MVIEEYWNIYKGEDGNVIFSVKGLDQEYLLLVLGLISRYLSLFEFKTCLPQVDPKQAISVVATGLAGIVPVA